MAALTMRSLMLFCMAFSASSASAAIVHDCNGYEPSAENIPEPWEAHTRTFADGNIRITVLDTIEPAAGAFHLLVLSPPYDEIGGRQCRLVSFETGEGTPIGYASLSLEGLDAGYDPARGLTIALPVSVFNPQTGLFDIGEMTVTINQSTGEITAEDAGT